MYTANCNINDIKEVKEDRITIPLTMLTWDIEVCFSKGYIEDDFSSNSNELICIGCSWGNV